MSKVVSGIGRGIKKVLSGIGKAAKKFVKSKIGKVIIGAALIYFTGGMAAGMMSGAGAGAGLSAAASQLGAAGSALLGGNLGAAGSAIASGFSGIAPGAAAGLAEGALAGGITEAGLGELGINTALEAGSAGGIASPGLVAEAAGGASNLAGLGELGINTDLAAGTGSSWGNIAQAGGQWSEGIAGATNGGLLPQAGGMTLPNTAASQGWSLGQAFQPLSGAARTASDYMTKNKLWGPAAYMGSGILQGMGQAGMQRAAYDREDQARQRAYQNWSVGNLILR